MLSMKDFLFVVAILFIATTVQANPSRQPLEDLATRYDRCMTANSTYEGQAVEAFWGDISFMKNCVKPGESHPNPFVIWCEVQPDGKIGRIKLDPETNTGRCIQDAVRTRTLPRPPTSDCVIKIEMSFSE